MLKKKNTYIRSMRILNTYNTYNDSKY